MLVFKQLFTILKHAAPLNNISCSQYYKQSRIIFLDICGLYSETIKIVALNSYTSMVFGLLNGVLTGTKRLLF
jgi:hypothetical protein